MKRWPRVKQVAVSIFIEVRGWHPWRVILRPMEALRRQRRQGWIIFIPRRVAIVFDASVRREAAFFCGPELNSLVHPGFVPDELPLPKDPHVLVYKCWTAIRTPTLGV